MPIFDQGYQHWQGKLSGHAWRWLTITRHGVRAQFKNRLTRTLILLAWLLPAAALGLVLILWGLLEQKSDLITPLLGMISLPADMMAGPRDYRVMVWTLAYYYFFQAELFVSMILVLLVGPSLISQDLRFNAIPLYFSRPLRRFDYFLGKLGVIAFFLSAVAIVPAVLAYGLGVCFSLDVSVLKDTFRILLGGVAYGLVVVVSAGMLMLALSSLSRNSRYVGAMWVGIWFLSSAVAGVLGEIEVDMARRQASQREMERMSQAPPGRFPADRAGRGRGPTRRAAEAIAEASLDAELADIARRDWHPLLSFTANLERIGVLFLDTNSAWTKLGKLTNPGSSGDALAVQMGPQYPWYWSAGVLAGLLGISLWILTFRVKSLDRLR